MRAVLESDVRQVQFPIAFDIDLFVGIDQNVADAWVLQQRLQWTETEDLIENFGDDLISFDRAEQGLLGVDQLRQRRPHLVAQLLSFNRSQGVEVDLIQQLAVERELEILMLLP